MVRFLNDPDRGRYRWRVVLVALALAALISLCLEYGFVRAPLPVPILIGVQLAAVAAYLVAVGWALWTAPTWGAALRRQWPELLLIALGAALILGEFEALHLPVLKMGTVYVGTIQVLLVVRFTAGAVRWNLELSQRQLHPARLLVTLFLIVILVGGALLCLPKAMTPPHRALEGYYLAKRLVGCFFTATSATCVTGLVVFDTGTDFTRFGQIVILVMIQLGGLGIMIFSSLFGVLIGKQLSLRQSLALQDAYSQHTIGQLRSMVRFIVLATFISEAFGALACYPMFAAVHEDLGERLFHCIFHAISAFCNAGFALQADSLTGFAGAWGVYVSIMPLIVVGGLGFPVLHDLAGWLRSRMWPGPPPRVEGAIVQPRARRPRYRLNLHTKLVLTTTVILIFAPAVLFFVFESIDWRTAEQRADADPATQMIAMSPGARARAALFQSITARTAGFNTVALDTDAMSPASHFLLMLLMFAGGSPASTAGGIKTIALAVLMLGAISTLRGRRHVEAYGRTVPRGVIERAAVVAFVMAAVIAVVTIVLSITEGGILREHLFEAVSACGTVGLSTGLTARLTIAGQLTIMLAMFVGRLGPLTMLIALAGGESVARYEYPEEQVIIG